LPPGREDAADAAPASGVEPPAAPEVVFEVLPPSEPEVVRGVLPPPEPDAPLEGEALVDPAAAPQVEPELPAPSPGIALELDDAPARDTAPAAAETRAVTLEYKGGGSIEEAVLAPASGDDPSPAAPAFGTKLTLEPHGTGAVVVLAGIG